MIQEISCFVLPTPFLDFLASTGSPNGTPYNIEQAHKPLLVSSLMKNRGNVFPSTPNYSLGMQVLVLSDSLYHSLDSVTAIRKGKRSCDVQPILNFVSYYALSPSTLGTLPSSTTPFLREALDHPSWCSAMEETHALEHYQTREMVGITGSCCG